MGDRKMSLTIIGVLQNADYNLHAKMPFQHELGKEQLRNALSALENGYGIYEDFDPKMLTEEKTDA
jgi:hypothetical protein